MTWIRRAVSGHDALLVLAATIAALMVACLFVLFLALCGFLS